MSHTSRTLLAENPLLRILTRSVSRSVKSASKLTSILLMIATVSSVTMGAFVETGIFDGVVQQKETPVKTYSCFQWYPETTTKSHPVQYWDCLKEDRACRSEVESHCHASSSTCSNPAAWMRGMTPRIDSTSCLCLAKLPPTAELCSPLSIFIRKFFRL